MDDATQRINLSWLLKLRWSAIAGQLLTIFFAQTYMHADLPLLPLLGVVALEGASNLAAVQWAKRTARVHDWELFSILGLDIGFLTLLLYFSGGPFNPFSFLYLVYVAQAAAVLPARWTWGLATLSFCFLGMLFLEQASPDHAHAAHDRVDHNSTAHGAAFMMHVQGMWVAFGIAAAFIVHFVSRVTRELSRARLLAVRAEKLASLATLATGAAHELSTPLSTIAVVAKELERDLRRHPGTEEATSDARLIRQEVERCREILVLMAADAGRSAGEEFQEVSVPALLEAAAHGLVHGDQVDVRVEGTAAQCRVRVPLRATAQAIRGVVKNAQQASPPGRRVLVRATVRGRSTCSIEVIDKGIGMSKEVLERAGEPFFTTKEPGQGLGLGLFLTRVVLDRLGGSIDFCSSRGSGTTAALTMPLAGVRG